MGNTDITPCPVITTQFIVCELSDVWTIKPLNVQPSNRLMAIQVGIQRNTFTMKTLFINYNILGDPHRHQGFICVAPYRRTCR